MFRLLRWLVRLVFIVVVVVALVVTVLWLTRPQPASSPGWERLADMSVARGEVAAAVADGKLVVAGGLRGAGTTSRDVSVYAIATDRWRPGRALPSPRHHAAAASVGKRVYVSGGARTATDWTPTTTVWRSRPGGRWDELPAMPEGRQGHAMVALGGRLYVVGGVGPSDRTLIYDVSRKRWTTGAPLPGGRDHLRAVAWDGRVWALGGRSGDPLRRVDIYDPRRDTWTSGPELPDPMSAMSVGVVDETLHVVGGEDPDAIGGGVSTKHFALDRNGDRWREDSAAILRVHGAGFGMYKDTLIIAGGASRQGALSTISWTGVTQSFEP